MPSNQTANPLSPSWGPLPKMKNRIEQQVKPEAPPREKFSKDQERKFEITARFYENAGAPHTAEEEAFRHSGWRVKRNRVRAVLASCGTGQFQMARFDNCGGEMRVEWSEQLGRHRVTANYCRCRHCEPCMRARSNKIRMNLLNRLKDCDEKKYRFTTVTLKHSDDPLADQLKRLYQSFAKLRRMPVWKESQKGGAMICEVKIGNDGKWHPHLHIISEGHWMDQREIRAAWYQITKDSHVVDVRLLDRAKDAANYVSKYVTKGCSDNVWLDLDRAQEWVTASKGLRICGTFGTWRGFALTKVDTTADDWQVVDSMTNLYQRARDGEEHAKHLLKLLRGDLTAVLEANTPTYSHPLLE